MTVRVLTSNGVSTYNITGLSHHAQLPDWLAKKNAKALKRDQSWSKRITLIQDFGFPEAALRLKFTPNQGHLVGCGVYKPQMRVFDLHEMSIKFERHLTADTVDFVVLGEEWQKVVVLGSDRSVDFHNSGGVYHQTRVPKAGRAMTYDPLTCDLLVVGSSPDVYRLNLERGQFMASLETDVTTGGLNGIDIGPEHGLYGVVGDGGLVEFWDRRDRQRVSSLQATTVADHGADPVCDMTAIKYVDALTVAIGDGGGQVRLFDLRSSRPLLTVDHKYGEPVKGIHYHHASDSLISFDSQAVRITKSPRLHGALLTTVCPSVKINDVCVDGHSGFMAMAVEDSQIYSFYCPSLGPAPRWAAYLDTVINVDDAADGGRSSQPTDSVYDNYKFVTDSQLEDLGLAHLRGTKLLRAYMHGHFIDQRLYEKARAIANPFALDQYRREQAARKLHEQRQSRIIDTTSGVGVGGGKKTKKDHKQVDDERFGKLLADDPDFAVDEDILLLQQHHHDQHKVKSKKQQQH